MYKTFELGLEYKVFVHLSKNHIEVQVNILHMLNFIYRQPNLLLIKTKLFLSRHLIPYKCLIIIRPSQKGRPLQEGLCVSPSVMVIVSN